MAVTLNVGQGKVGSEVLGEGPYLREANPLLVGVGFVGDSALGSQILNPRTFLGPGIVVGSPLGFVGDGRVGATDSASSGYRNFALPDKSRLGFSSLNDSKLFAYYPMDEGGTSQLCRDLSGNRFPVAFKDGWIPGRVGQVPNFTHVVAAGLKDASTTGTVASFSMWVYVPTGTLPAGVDAVVYSFYDQLGPPNLLLGVSYPTATPFIQVVSSLDVPAVNNRLTAPAITQGAWTHLIFSYDGSAYSISVNGFDQTLVVGTGSNNGKGIPSVMTTITALGDSPTTSLDDPAWTGGTIGVSDFAMWTRLLTQNEKQQLAQFSDSVYGGMPARWTWVDDALKSQVSAAVTGAASLTATLRGAGAIAAAASGSASLTATLRGSGALSGAATGLATFTAAIKGAGALAAAATGTATLTATLRGAGAIAASATGLATLTATLRGVGALNGAATGTATLTAAIRGAGALNGTATGTATLTGVLRGTGALNGAATGAAALTAALRGTGALNGAATGAASLTAAVRGAGTLAASATGTASLTAALHALYAIAASILGTCSLTADLEALVVGGVPIENEDVLLADVAFAVALVLSDQVVVLQLSDQEVALASSAQDVSLADTDTDVFEQSTDQLVTI